MECPAETEQIGGLNADIGGCGLEGCNARYQDNYADIDECKAGCDDDARCVSFSWAPLNGDRNHQGKTVCTLYNSKTSNQQWGPEQILCALKPTISPTDEPTKAPTDEPTISPTDEPTSAQQPELILPSLVCETFYEYLTNLD